MPITEAVYQVLFEGKSVEKAIADLMKRRQGGIALKMSHNLCFVFFCHLNKGFTRRLKCVSKSRGAAFRGFYHFQAVRFAHR
jgi:hypothetical protein